MTIDERLEALTHTVELLATMQKTTEKNLNRLTREVRLFRHFVLSMGANIEARLLNLEETDTGLDEDNSQTQGILSTVWSRANALLEMTGSFSILSRLAGSGKCVSTSGSKCFA